MQEFKAARLSVSKVSPEEWTFIVNNLIEGYEGEGAGSVRPTQGAAGQMETVEE